VSKTGFLQNIVLVSHGFHALSYLALGWLWLRLGVGVGSGKHGSEELKDHGIYERLVTKYKLMGKHLETDQSR
jgi:hypothetical protein